MSESGSLDPAPILAVGIDTGGTFTDCVLLAGDRPPVSVKLPSTPQDPSAAIIDGLEQLCAAARVPLLSLALLAHGTTVATNAMLEGRWARAGLLTTAGFRDVLEIGSQKRPHLYGLQQQKSPPIIPREHRFDVRERSAPDGTEIMPLSEADVRAAVAELLARGVESIAITFLFSYAAADHERRAREIARELAPDAYVCCSADVNPELREYERISTTAINAALAPIVRRYLGELRQKLASRSFSRPVHIMQSNGGLVSSAHAEEAAHSLILSGPAGGLVASAAVSEVTGYSDVLTLDMGGTSCDVGVIVGGRPRLQYGTLVADRYPLQIPLLDLHTIGAGGGSIAWSDAGGALKVGPRSAGALPGPACYGRGGTAATVTDAHLFLGRLDSASFLGGRYALDKAAAEAALQALAAETQLDVTRAAYGILEVVDANMIGALRVVSTQRGLDPRDFALIAFGGAGPLHGCSIARDMGIRTVIIPPRPGLLSALGIALSEIRHNYVRTWIGDARTADTTAIEAVFAALEARAREQLTTELVPETAVRLARSLDMRYRGQEYSLNVPVPRPMHAGSLPTAVEHFHALHDTAYGHAAVGEPVEIVNARLLATGQINRARLPVGDADLDTALPTGERPVYFAMHGWVSTPVVHRATLAPHEPLAGPTIIEQMDTTTVILPGDTASVDGHGNIIVTVADS